MWVRVRRDGGGDGESRSTLVSLTTDQKVWNLVGGKGVTNVSRLATSNVISN